MNILVIGNGAREHAIIWKLQGMDLSARSAGGQRNYPKHKIYCTIGNAGINEIAEPVNIQPNDINSLLCFAKDKNIEFTVVGPEVPLSSGIVDEFQNNNLKIFGPSYSAARIETSKVFAKDFMLRHDIPTAKYRTFGSSSKNEALEYLNNSVYPLVIKADGLAAGKGVVICEDMISAKKTINDIFEKKIFGNAGDSLVIEDFLKGNEASVFAVTDGTDYVLLPPACDHKKIHDGEKGKNTGGMGSFAPAYDLVNENVLNNIKRRIIEPVLNNMKKEGNEYKGCLYCGLMIDDNGNPFVVEFNARLGDPETQVLLPLIKSNFLELLIASAEGAIKEYNLEVYSGYYCSVVLASKGYPDKYETEKEITGLDNVLDNCIIFHAGTKRAGGKIVSTGGRVLNVVGKSDRNLKDAIEAAYKNAELINFENKYYRRDIGLKGL